MVPHPQQIHRVIKMTQMLVLDFAVSMIIKARDLKKKNLIKANDGAFLLLNSWRVKPIRHIHQILSTKFLETLGYVLNTAQKLARMA